MSLTAASRSLFRLLPQERNEPHASKAGGLIPFLGHSLDAPELLIASDRSHGDDQDAAHFELGKKRLRYVVGGGRHNDRVKWRFFGPTKVPVPMPHLAIREAEIDELARSRVSQRGDQLDGEHRCAHIGPNGALGP